MDKQTKIVILIHLMPVIGYAIAVCNGPYNNSSVTVKNSCVCPGHITVYKCTVVGGGTTVWRGSAFDCMNSGNEISLLHSRFHTLRGTSGICNGGKIVAQSVEVESDCYTSQLNVTVTPDVIGKSVQCCHDNGLITQVISSFIIDDQLITNVTITLTDNSPGHLSFSWSNSSTRCQTQVYDIYSSHCGKCLTRTAYAGVTCTNVPTDGGLCKFAVRSASVDCVNLTGEWTETFNVTIFKGNASTSTINIIIAASVSSAVSLILLCFCLLCVLLLYVVYKWRKTTVREFDQSTTKDEDNQRYQCHSLRLPSTTETVNKNYVPTEIHQLSSNVDRQYEEVDVEMTTYIANIQYEDAKFSQLHSKLSESTVNIHYARNSIHGSRVNI